MVTQLKAKPNVKEKASSVVVRVVGTSPLSFETPIGARLEIREIGPSSYSRPSVGGKFKKSAYLLYRGITKVGRLSPAAVSKIGEPVPENCFAVEVNPVKKLLKVQFY